MTRSSSIPSGHNTRRGKLCFPRLAAAADSSPAIGAKVSFHRPSSPSSDFDSSGYAVYATLLRSGARSVDLSSNILLHVHIEGVSSFCISTARITFVLWLADWESIKNHIGTH
ncbi:hypothetical protein AKJ16_DCAP12620 [Drosera capensis]